jgi:hypothetical protein
MSSTSSIRQIKHNQLYLDFCGRHFVPFFRPEGRATLFLSSLFGGCFELKRLVFSTNYRLFNDTLFLVFVRNFRGVDKML